MRFITENQSKIEWMAHPERFEGIADTVKKIMDAGKWEEFLEIFQDDKGVIYCDALYEYLRYSSGDALQDVGLHNNEATATIEDVLTSWEEEHAADGLKVSRLEDGTPFVFDLYDYGEEFGGITLDFESVNESGEVETVTLDADEVFDLLRHRIICANNATRGAWTCADESTAIFEMWRARD